MFGNFVAALPHLLMNRRGLLVRCLPFAQASPTTPGWGLPPFVRDRSSAARQSCDGPATGWRPVGRQVSPVRMPWGPVGWAPTGDRPVPKQRGGIVAVLGRGAIFGATLPVFGRAWRAVRALGGNARNALLIGVFARWAVIRKEPERYYKTAALPLS